MADSLTSVLPRGTAVSLGSRTYRVFEARLCDLADLQAWLDDQFVSPVEGLEERIAGLSEVDADRLLFDAYIRAEDGPPTYDSAEGTRLLFTPEGIAFFLGLALKRGGVDTAHAASLLRDDPPTSDQYARLRRAFFGCDDLHEIRRLMGVPPHRTPGKSLTLGQAIHQFIQETDYRLRLADVALMSLSEFIQYRRVGEPLDTSINGTMETLIDLNRRRDAVLRADAKDGE